VDQDPESRSRRAKMTDKNRKKVKKYHVLKCWMFSFEHMKASPAAWTSIMVLYGGLA
jgi:hypothetical protein